MNLYEAVKNQNVDLVRKLLSENNCLNKCREDLLLHLAVSLDNLSIVALLANYMPVDSTDLSGRTVLSLAAHYGNESILEFLLEKKAAVNLSDHDGNTPIFYAKNRRIVELLVQHGANLHLINKDNQDCIKFHESNGIFDLSEYLATAKNFSKDNTLKAGEESLILLNRFVSIDESFTKILHELDIDDKNTVRGIIIDGERYKVTSRFYDGLASVFKIQNSMFSIFSPIEIIRRLAQLNPNSAFTLTLDTHKKEALAIIPANRLFLQSNLIMDCLNNDSRTKLIKYENGIIKATLDLPEKWDIPNDSPYEAKIVCSTPVDGLNAPYITLGFMRQICSNGAVANHSKFKTKMQISDGSGSHFAKLLSSFSNKTGFEMLEQALLRASITTASVRELLMLDELLTRNIREVNNRVLLRERLDNIAGNPCVNYGVSSLLNIKEKKRSLTPVACSVADLLNFSTELTTHHQDLLVNSPNFEIYFGKMIANNFDFEDIHYYNNINRPYLFNDIQFQESQQ